MGRGGDGQDGTPTERFAQETTVPDRPYYPPDDRGQRPWACLWKHEQREPYVNRWGNKASGCSRFIRGTAAALRSWLLTNVPTPNCFCKFFSCKTCPEIISVNLFHARHVRKHDLSSAKPGHITGRSRWGGARRDGEAGREQTGRVGDGSGRPGDNCPSYLPDDRRQRSRECFWKHEQREPYVNRWGNKARG